MAFEYHFPKRSASALNTGARSRQPLKLLQSNATTRKRCRDLSR